MTPTPALPRVSSAPNRCVGWRCRSPSSRSCHAVDHRLAVHDLNVCARAGDRDYGVSPRVNHPQASWRWRAWPRVRFPQPQCIMGMTRSARWRPCLADVVHHLLLSSQATPGRQSRPEAAGMNSCRPAGDAQALALHDQGRMGFAQVIAHPDGNKPGLVQQSPAFRQKLHARSRPSGCWRARASKCFLSTGGTRGWARRCSSCHQARRWWPPRIPGWRARMSGARGASAKSTNGSPPWSDQGAGSVIQHHIARQNTRLPLQRCHWLRWRQSATARVNAAVICIEQNLPGSPKAQTAAAAGTHGWCPSSAVVDQLALWPAATGAIRRSGLCSGRGWEERRRSLLDQDRATARRRIGVQGDVVTRAPWPAEPA